jgi:hypothetical protein
MALIVENKVLELFGISTRKSDVKWRQTIKAQNCPYSSSKCFKIRKSNSGLSIGTCSVRYGRQKKDMIICPKRLLERNKVFTDCIHLLTLHEPGNNLHVVSEVLVPGGSVDYFLVSSREGKVKDFVAIEFQAMDTTGTVWPERQRLLASLGLTVPKKEVASKKSFGMNWKMTAKTILVQLHHKVETLEHIGKHLVLVIQDYLLEYLKAEFNFDHLNSARIGDSVHIHGYELIEKSEEFQIQLNSRLSTDTEGIANCLGIQAETRVDLQELVQTLEQKISEDSLLNILL